MGPSARWAEMDSPVKPANDAKGGGCRHHPVTPAKAGVQATVVSCALWRYRIGWPTKPLDSGFRRNDGGDWPLASQTY